MNFTGIVRLPRIRRVLLVVFLVAWIVSGSIRPARANSDPALPAGQEIPRFEEAPCMVALPSGLVEGQDIDCGYLIVPEEYADRSGPTIQLGVVIYHSQDPNPKPDPLVMLQGGPGGSTIETYLQVIPTNGRLLADRDIIKFDQRGTLYARPGLDCPEFMDLMIATLDQDLTDEEDIRLSLQTLQTCRDRLVNKGIDLSAYDSVENAADVESLRQALGYEKINLCFLSNFLFQKLI